MELRELYDENKTPTGRTFVKGEQVPEGYYYLIVKIFIQNDKNEFLIQKRVERKGGRWSITGGHPKAGETSLEGIQREVCEEIGLKLQEKDFKFLKSFIYKQSIREIWLIRKDIELNELTLKDNEVIDAKFVTLSEFIQMLNNKEIIYSLSYFIDIYNEICS